MLAQLFATVFWMSITATIVAVVVVLASLLLGWWHVPRKFICLLYALVLLRMVCPLGLPGDWGLFHLPFIQTVQEMAADFSGYSGEYEVAVEGSAEYDAAVAAGLTPERLIEDAPQSALYVPYRLGGDGSILPAQRAMETWVPKVAAVWLAGMAVFYGLTAVSYFRLRRRLRFAVREEDGVYVSDRIPSPTRDLVFRPRIYLVPGLSAEERAHILAHERAHLRAGDHWAKLIAWLALGVHWFNFYLWSVYRCYCSDLEKACDERVLRAADVEARKAYSRTLLHLACDRRFVWFNPRGLCRERNKRAHRPCAASAPAQAGAAGAGCGGRGAGGAAGPARRRPDPDERRRAGGGPHRHAVGPADPGAGRARMGGLCRFAHGSRLDQHQGFLRR